ncbi:hypothetical protein GO988_15845 [Hymenobacter sp. HMF4947]|uniref:Uncharacterized protein n=1 Tax=Hymenobacter ginkgonis TaxID=2682976 RepID=A0A7K1THD6_9BACT|nr:hypothetical protein [Hymenobacter ginkgonis]MVN77804.1 hypothetical protein [Hymenobacter ginkgonis]
MRRLLSPLLLAFALVLGVSACAKKDQPLPTLTPTPGVGSYLLDGRLISCQVMAQLSSRMNKGGQTFEDLLITLNTTAPTTGTSEALTLNFERLAGQPPYVLTSSIYHNSSQAVGASYDNNRLATLTETSTGVLEGTFSGTTFYTATSTITNGVFKDARLP